MPLGTLTQQLLAVERYLSIPAPARREIGEDVLWVHVHQCVMAGVDNPAATVIDVDFRNVVRQMRQLQMQIRAAKDPEKKAAAVHNARELERIVDKELE